MYLLIQFIEMATLSNFGVTNFHPSFLTFFLHEMSYILSDSFGLDGPKPIHFNLKHLVYRFQEVPGIVKAVMLGLRRISKPSCWVVSMWVALFFLLLPAIPLQAELQQSLNHSFEEDFQPSFSIGSPKYKCHRSNSSRSGH